MSDLIRRQDAIDAIYKESKLANSEVADEYAEMFVYALKTLPSKEQKTGECIPSKAVKIFTEAYRKTQTRLYVKKPMSYAFYEVWKYYDRHEKPRW